MFYRLRSISGALALFALAALPAHAQPTGGPVLVVSNPSPGDRLTPGSLNMQGVAFDSAASQGAGVDRVSVFLDNREAGGFFLGDARLGTPNTQGSRTSQFANAGWTLTTPAINGFGDGHELYVYARSSVTGDETVIHFPVLVGHKPQTTTSAPPETITPD